jgi:DNA invertase Pin-like site-specific DNA recombinase
MPHSRVAIYARVSTDDRGQDPENQLCALRAWCISTSYPIVGEYVDQVSGAKGADKRPEFARLMADAHQRKFDLVLCWALDRFSREGMIPTVLHLQRLAAAGVGFHSYTEPLLSTDNEMVRDIVLAVMAGLAKQERIKLAERTRAGLARVREKGSRSGKAIGRPRLSAEREEAVRTALSDVLGIRKTARLVGTGNATVAKIAAQMRGSARQPVELEHL